MRRPHAKELAPVHPGEVLWEEFMRPADLSTASLAGVIDVSVACLNEVIAKRGAVTPDMAQRLAGVFATSERFWTNLQATYDRSTENLVRRQAGMTRRPRHTLDELLAQCDPTAPRTPEEQEWLDLKPVGREFGAVRVLPVSRVRRELNSIIRRGESVVIEKRGRVMVQIVPLDGSMSEVDQP